MKKLSIAAVMVAVAVAVPLSIGSSHREAPNIMLDPTADNTDTYAFTAKNAPGALTVAANWIPGQVPANGPNFFRFDDRAVYYLNIDNTGDGRPDIRYRYTFRTHITNRNTFLHSRPEVTSLRDPDFFQRQTYDIVKETAQGDRQIARSLPVVPSNVGNKTMPNYRRLSREGVKRLPGGGKVFVGQRDEPFFIDLGATFDNLNLRLPPGNAGLGKDDFSGQNTNSIVMQLPEREVTRNRRQVSSTKSNSAVVGVWASTDRRRLEVTNADFDEARADGSSGSGGSGPRPAGGMKGTDGDDVLVGTRGDDVIRCGAGNDEVDAGAGDDVIFCGSGDDLVRGGPGDDRIFGESGDDDLFGESGNDLLDGGSGDDDLFGGSGDDELRQGSGSGARAQSDGSRGSEAPPAAFAGGAGASPSAGSSGGFVQVSRLANPLVNELFPPAVMKDLYNRTTPAGDRQRFGRFILNPEVARILNREFPIVRAPERGRDDLVRVLLQGLRGLNRQVSGPNPPAVDTMKINLGIPPALVPNRFGILAGDKAGFPNGRRLEDDIVDIDVRLIAGFLKRNKQPLGDGVVRNDKPFLSEFPYLAEPTSGFESNPSDRIEPPQPPDPPDPNPADGR